MSDATSTPKKTKKAAAKPKAKSSHPKYIDMVVTAIKTLSERGGSSRQAISKYIIENYTVGDSIKSQLKMCLKRGVASGALVHAKGTGASGSFKVAGDKKAEKKVVKKTVAKKATPKKVAVKAKKATTPVKKAVVMKTTPKKKPAAKVAKKPAAKKSPKKKPAAKTAKKPVAKRAAKK